MKELILFLGNNEQVIHTEKCEIDELYKKNLYKPSADGVFTVHILNAPFDIKHIFGMQLELKGSYIDTRQFRRRSKFRIRHFNQTISPEI